jgi:starvation-inducible DNA-binding protein
MNDLIEELGSLLADTVSMKFRAHGFHWNVVGPDFPQLHKLFGKIYADLDDSIDPIAESLRKLGAPAPFRLSDFLALAEIPESASPTDATGMINELIDGLDGLLMCLVDSSAAAEEANQQGIFNMLADRVGMTQMWLWQLRVMVGRPFPDVVIPEPVEPVDPLTGEDINDPESAPIRALAMRLELAKRN